MKSDIKKRLRDNGFSYKQIDAFMIIYSKAIEDNIPFPFYYSFLKLKT